MWDERAKTRFALNQALTLTMASVNVSQLLSKEELSIKANLR